jgi:type IV/VI secretion system ImpK/VasF family protein
LTLFELARELFTYLVRFREKASSTAAPPLPEVRRDLLGVFARMDNQAKRDPLLMEPYHQVHYALVGLADEVVLTSGWEHSPAWRQALLEERFYNSQEAGSRFFVLANNLDHAPQDVVAIFYLCLALGFSGRYAPADPELAEVKDKLLARLPSKPRIMEEPPSTRSQDRQARKWLWSSAAAAIVLFAVVFGWDHFQKNKVAKVVAPPKQASQPTSKEPPAQEVVEPPAKQEAAQVTEAKAEPALADKSKSEPAPKTESKPEPEPASTPKPESTKAEAVKPEPSKPSVETKPTELAKAEEPEQPAEEPTTQSATLAAAPPAAKETPAAAPRPVTTIHETVTPPATAPLEKSYRVRVGVYVGPIQSSRFADSLKKDGFPTSVEKLDRPGGKVLYIVSITPLASLDDAERVQAEVREKYKVNGVIKQN